MLAESPREDVEWIMWMDMDTIIADQAFALPWARYDGYDMVVWGVRERIEEGEVEGENPRSHKDASDLWCRGVHPSRCSDLKYVVEWEVIEVV